METDNPADTGVVAVAAVVALGFSLGSAYPADAGAFLKALDANEHSGNSTSYIVTASWDTEFDRDPEEIAESPLDRPAVFSLSGESKDIAIVQDLDGDCICNSAALPYQGITAPVAVGNIQVSQNVASIAGAVVLGMMNKTNADAWVTPFGTFPIGKCLVKGVSAKQVFEDTLQYYTVDWQIAYDPVGWQLTLQDEGTQQLAEVQDQPEWVRVPIYVGGNPTNEPVPLDGLGRVLPKDDPPVYQLYTIYGTANYTGVIG